MKLIRNLAALAAFACAAPAIAQTTTAVVVPTCGTPPTTYVPGQNRLITQDTTGTLCTPTGGGGGGGGTSGGTATSAPPTYSNGATGQALSLDLSGNLRTVIGALPPLAAGSNVIGGITVADGSDSTLGAKADSAWLGTGSASLIALNKAIYGALIAPLPAGTNAIGAITNTSFGISGSLPAFASTPTVNIGTAPTIGVTGTFWQATQPVSIATMPTTPVTGTFWQTTQPISAASLPLPTGAAVSVAQASTTSGQSGDLVMGAVTTAAPAYTTAQTNPLSLTTGGGLRGDMASYAGTALTGTVTAYGTAPTGNVFGVNASVTGGTIGTVTNLSTIASNIPVYAVAAGSANKAAGVTQSTAVSQTDASGAAYTGGGIIPTTPTLIASAQGGGAAVSAEINVTTLTLGTATAVIFCLDESTGGTNTTDIWCSDPITTTGITRVPAIPVAGRRSWHAFNLGGASTNVTATITTLELPTGSYPVQRQFRDYYAASNPFATRYNSAALTASNFVLGTLGTATTPFYIEGTKQLSAFMTLAGSPTVTTQPVVTLQVSFDGTNFASVTGATMTAAGNGTYIMPSQSVGGYKFARLLVSTAAAYSAGAYTISNIGVNAVN